ncbi:hypothetical protein K1719_006821 [Acacia pycnantha]|nr:hypothetical protein K1719_006821 [Acacia pycnantha]
MAEFLNAPSQKDKDHKQSPGHQFHSTCIQPIHLNLVMVWWVQHCNISLHHHCRNTNNIYIQYRCQKCSNITPNATARSAATLPSNAAATPWWQLQGWQAQR